MTNKNSMKMARNPHVWLVSMDLSVAGLFAKPPGLRGAGRGAREAAGAAH